MTYKSQSHPSNKIQISEIIEFVLFSPILLQVFLTWSSPRPGIEFLKRTASPHECTFLRLHLRIQTAHVSAVSTIEIPIKNTKSLAFINKHEVRMQYIIVGTMVIHTI